MSRFGESEHAFGFRRIAANVQIVAQHDDRNAGAIQQIDQIVAELGQLLVAVLDFFVDRIKLFVGRFQFFLRGLQFLVGALQFLVAGLNFFVGRLQLFVGRFLRFDDRLQIFLGAGEFLLELRDLDVFRIGTGFRLWRRFSGNWRLGAPRSLRRARENGC